jgi:myosin heavy subunit
VRHFAGEVKYDVAGFMDKNRDSLRNELAVLVKKSEVSFVKLLFGDRPVSETVSSSPTMGILFLFLSFTSMLPAFRSFVAYNFFRASK